MKIGVIGAFDAEIDPFIEQMSGVSRESAAKRDFACGRYSQVDVVAVEGGICKVNAAIAATILLERFKCTHLVVTGTAGGVDDNMAVLDTAISTGVAHRDIKESILLNNHPFLENIFIKADQTMVDIIKKADESGAFSQKLHYGSIVSGEGFVTGDEFYEIKGRFNPLCVDMETAAIAHVCHVYGVPFVAIRSVSDSINHQGEGVFEQNAPQAALNSISVLKRLIAGLSS